MILVDTSGLLAAMFTDQRDHDACRAVLEAAEPPLLLSPFVLAELDYLVSRHAGVDAELALLEDVAEGAYELTEFGALDVAAAADVAAQHRDLNLGIADASIVVLSQRYRTNQVLTLDQRHFRTVPAFDSLPFHILPADG
ncbi:type II toxin-antitoxin system VapC family toxin [Euzebya tangerina]|uniref:type II toxin-antitoxin system VapC family toxin n=1 Tax=Euzebya tangerina TaxID=591198 RepID=UPI000E323637|nr:PIN domain-containing protein [Euzebya tangerina]